MRQLRDKAEHSLRTLRSLSRTEASALVRSNVAPGSKKVNWDGLVASLYGIPLFQIEATHVSHEVDKITNQARGQLKVTLTIDPGYSRRGKSRDKDSADESSFNLAIVLGSWQQRRLLSHKKVGFHQSKVSTVAAGSTAIITTEVVLSFDWKSALADGGNNESWIILRVMADEFRGLDMEQIIQVA